MYTVMIIEDGQPILVGRYSDYDEARKKAGECIDDALPRNRVEIAVTCTEGIYTPEGDEFTEERWHRMYVVP